MGEILKIVCTDSIHWFVSSVEFYVEKFASAHYSFAEDIV